jgi:hypothetical protein
VRARHTVHRATPWAELPSLLASSVQHSLQRAVRGGALRVVVTTNVLSANEHIGHRLLSGERSELLLYGEPAVCTCTENRSVKTESAERAPGLERACVKPLCG